MNTYLITSDGKHPGESYMKKLEKLHGKPVIFIDTLEKAWKLIKCGDAVAVADGIYKGDNVIIEEEDE